MTALVGPAVAPASGHTPPAPAAAPAPDRGSSGAPSTPTAAAPADERIQTKGLLGTFLARPEIGALVGAIVVALFFAVAAPSITQAQSISTVLYGASTIGIMVVGVSLLMIGGEFDLSTGVAVITSALAASMFSWFFAVNVWVGVGMALLTSLLIGLINGWLLMRTKLPSFIVTLATFLMLNPSQVVALVDDLEDAGPPAHVGPSEPDERYYEIRGDFLVLRSTEIRTLNLDYFAVTLEETPPGVLEETPAAE